MSIRNEIELDYGDLLSGESRYDTCPACDRKGKFSVTRNDDGILLYHCFRNSCSLHTGGAIGGTWVRTRTAPPARKRARFDYPTRKCTEEERQFLRDNLGWTDFHFKQGRVTFCDQLVGYVFPITDAVGQPRGSVVRRWNGMEPKALTYLEGEDTPRLSHYLGPARSTGVVVVEDIPSAIKASEWINAVALLGTDCNNEAAEEIASRYDHVYWALDDDAFTQALKLQQQHSILFMSSQCMYLKKDIKDMDRDELIKLLGEDRCVQRT